MAGPNPATTNWVPVWDTTGATSGGGGGTLTAHHITHEQGGTDPIIADAAAATPSLRTLGTGANQAASGNDSRLSNNRTPTAHAATHSLGGTDPVTVTNLAGYPGGVTTFLRADKTFAAPPATAPSAHHATHETGGVDAIASLSGGIIDSGTVNDARLSSNVALRNAANNFTQSQSINCPSPTILLRDSSQPIDAKHFYIVSSNNLYFQAYNEAGNLIQGQFLIYRNGGIYLTGDINAPNANIIAPNSYQWTNGPLDPANYFANPSGSATFVDAIPYVYRYLIMGKTLFFQVGVRLMAGDFTNEFRVKLPSGLTAKPYVVTGIPGSNNQVGVPAHWANVSSTGSGLAMAFIDTINNCISVQRADTLGAAWDSGNAYILRFSIDVPLA